MKRFAILAAAALLSSTSAMAAVYDSGNVKFQYYAFGSAFSGLGSPSTFATPGNATFFTYFNVSVAGSQIIYRYLEDTEWTPSGTSLNSDGLFVENGAVIFSLAGIPTISGVTLDGASILGNSGFNASNITFNGGGVAVTWGGQHFAPGDTVILNVSGDSVIPGVPEPASWALMIAGFGLVGGAMRRRAKVTVSYC